MTPDLLAYLKENGIEPDKCEEFPYKDYGFRLTKT